MSIETAMVPQVFGVGDEDCRTVLTFYRAFSEQDPALLDTALAVDWQDIPLGPGQQPGRDGMKPLVRAFCAAFPDVKITVHEMLGVAGRIAVRAEITGTHQGEWFGVAPTGRRFAFPLHEFHRVADGRLTHTWHLEDWSGWLRQVGALAGQPD